MGRHAEPVHLDRAASGARQPGDEPVVLNGHVARGNQEIGEVDHLAGGIEHLGAEQQPGGMFAARPERPEPGELAGPVSVQHRLAARCDHRRDHRVRIGAVHVLARRAGEVRHHPAMGVHDAEHPGGGRAAFGDRGDNVEMRAHRQFVAAAAARLDHPEQAGFADPGHVLGRHPTVALSLGDARLEILGRRLGPLSQLRDGFRKIVVKRVVPDRGHRPFSHRSRSILHSTGPDGHQARRRMRNRDAEERPEPRYGRARRRAVRSVSGETLPGVPRRGLLEVTDRGIEFVTTSGVAEPDDSAAVLGQRVGLDRLAGPTGTCR